MADAGDLLRAYNDTTRVQLDMGADPAILEQIGFTSFEETQKLIADLPPRTQEAARAVGQVVCLDCGQVIPCQHAGMRKNGHGFTRSS